MGAAIAAGAAQSIPRWMRSGAASGASRRCANTTYLKAKSIPRLTAAPAAMMRRMRLA